MDDIREILARNLTRLMDSSEEFRTQTPLAEKAGVSQRTVGNYKNALYTGYPQLDKVDAIAKCFGLRAWNLLHPTLGNKQISDRELQMYAKWREDMKSLLKQ